MRRRGRAKHKPNLLGRWRSPVTQYITNNLMRSQMGWVSAPVLQSRPSRPRHQRAQDCKGMGVETRDISQGEGFHSAQGSNTGQWTKQLCTSAFSRDAAHQEPSVFFFSASFLHHWQRPLSSVMCSASTFPAHRRLSI